MKTAFVVILIILIVGLLFYLSSDKVQKFTPSRPGQDTRKDDKQQAKDSAAGSLRNMALTMPPGQFGVKPSTGETIVYGVVMDLGMDRGVATIISFNTGEASLYLSTGGGILGGGKGENVSKAAKHFVSVAQKHLNKATKAETTEMAGRDSVKFYLLTTRGVYVGQDAVKNFEDNSSPWTEMFFEGNKVLTELRLTSGK